MKNSRNNRSPKKYSAKEILEPKGRSAQKAAPKPAQKSHQETRHKPVQKPAHKSARPPAKHHDKPPLAHAPRDKARWVVGLHSCEEAIKIRGKGVREVWLRDDWESSQQLREVQALAETNRVSIKTKSSGQLDAVGSGNQGVAVACTESPTLDWEALKAAESAIVLILDGIEDPHNLGSILRTAWLTGVTALFIPTDRAVGLTPAACKIASGGAEHVAVEAEPNLPSVMEQLKEAGFWIYGLSESGTRKPWEFQLGKKTAWVIGNEGSGIRKSTERACDELVRIPQVSSGSSYNASIACSMALIETCRQFGKPE